MEKPGVSFGSPPGNPFLVHLIKNNSALYFQGKKQNQQNDRRQALIEGGSCSESNYTEWALVNSCPTLGSALAYVAEGGTLVNKGQHLSSFGDISKATTGWVAHTAGLVVCMRPRSEEGRVVPLPVCRVIVAENQALLTPSMLRRQVRDYLNLKDKSTPARAFLVKIGETAPRVPEIYARKPLLAYFNFKDGLAASAGLLSNLRVRLATSFTHDNNTFYVYPAEFRTQGNPKTDVGSLSPI